MEPLVSASAFTAGPGLVRVLGAVLSGLALAVTILVLAGTAAERDSRLLAFGRAVCLAFTGLLAAVGFFGLLTRWGLVVACIACLLGLLAAALRYGQGPPLRRYLEARDDEQEPAWWPAFEHGFRCYTTAPRREQNPLRRAVTLPRSPAGDAAGGGSPPGPRT